MAEKWLDWNRIGPLAAQFQAVIAADIKADTRKLSTTEDFTARLTKDREETPGDPGGPGFGPPGMFGPGGRGGRGGPGGMDDSPQLSLKSFVEQRRAYLLALDEVKQAKL